MGKIAKGKELRAENLERRVIRGLINILGLRGNKSEKYKITGNVQEMSTVKKCS
jgi:hypothetical protein